MIEKNAGQTLSYGKVHCTPPISSAMTASNLHLPCISFDIVTCRCVRHVGQNHEALVVPRERPSAKFEINLCKAPNGGGCILPSRCWSQRAGTGCPTRDVAPPNWQHDVSQNAACIGHGGRLLHPTGATQHPVNQPAVWRPHGVTKPSPAYPRMAH